MRALILDYEAAFVRQNPITGKHYLGTTHLPWVGERTRGINGAHIDTTSESEQHRCR